MVPPESHKTALQVSVRRFLFIFATIFPTKSAKKSIPHASNCGSNLHYPSIVVELACSYGCVTHLQSATQRVAGGCGSELFAGLCATIKNFLLCLVSPTLIKKERPANASHSQQNMDNTLKVYTSTSFGHFLDGCSLSCHHSLGKLLVGVARREALAVKIIILYS